MPVGEPVDVPHEFGFHGTHRDIPGGKILPPNVHGGVKKYDETDADWTYFAPREDQAWAHATESGDPNDTSGGRPRVYVTKPIGQQFYDKSLPMDGTRSHFVDILGEDDQKASQAKAVKSQEIVGELWGPQPPRNAVTEMGLPHVNWRQFGVPNWRVIGGRTKANPHGGGIVDDAGEVSHWGTLGKEEPVTPSRKRKETNGQTNLPGFE